jgi:peptidoglycan/LPS O-acetylase OafA/YrhL
MKSKQIEALVWLRALAAFLVVLSHSIRASEVSYTGKDEVGFLFPFSFIDLGTFGVYLFFALSGCTLFLSSDGKVNVMKDFVHFYFKRFMRIWPAFAISLLIYIIFIEFFRYSYTSDNSYWIASFLKECTFGNILQYLSLTYNITGPSNLFAGPYWSLPVEFQYYLLLPVALYFMKNKITSLVFPLIFGALLYICYQKSFFDFDRYEIFKMGYTFFGGVFLAAIYKNFHFNIPTSISAVCFALILLLVILIQQNVIEIPANVLFFSDKYNVYGVIALFSLALSLFMRPYQISNKFVQLVNHYGEISYSIYLFHMLFIGLSVLIVINMGIYNAHLKFLFIFSFSVIGSYFLSVYTYKFIEIRSIAFARNTINKTN